MPLGNGVNLRFSGSLPGGERWATGMWFGLNTSAVTQAQLKAAIDGIPVTSSSPLATSIARYLDSGSALDTITGYAYPASGATATAVYSRGVNIAGGGTRGAGPNQMCAVASLRSTVLTRAGRGRMYVPANGTTLSSTDGQLAQAGMDGLTSGLVALAASVKTALGTWVVYSTTQSTAAAVTSVTVDSRPDIQRRRANKQVPTRTSTALVS